VNVALLLIPFAAPIVVGCAVGVWSWWRPRHALDAAFRAGRTDTVVHLPAVPRSVEAWPVWIAIAQDEAA
jgi:hypothetical protein